VTTEVETRAPERRGERIGSRELGIVSIVSIVWLLLVRAGPLSLPYFWDEADVYVAGARWLADHDMDPTPGHFPDDWSRGHPPLLYMLAAIAFRLSGPGPVVGHLLMLPFAALGLTCTYALGLERFGRAAAVAATALLATTPLYLTMGAFLLPEMPLTALTVAALWGLHRRNMLAVALLGIAMVWLKETGIFTAGAIGLTLIVDRWRTGTLRSPESVRELALATLPLWALVGFFLWQRATAGYFVFPHHPGLPAERQFELASLFTAVPSIFLWHGRWVVTLAAAIALPFALRRRRDLLLEPVALASLVLALMNVFFFAQMFWLERYALPAHPGWILMALGVVAIGFEGWRESRVASPPTPTLPRSRGRETVLGRARISGREAVLAVVAVPAVAWGLWAAAHPAPGDAPELSFAYADVMRSHASVARVLREHEDLLGADPLVVGVWPLTVELRDPVLGFTDRPFRTLHIDHLVDHPDVRVDVVIIDPSSTNRERLRELADDLDMVPIAAIEEGSAPPLEIRARAPAVAVPSTP